MNDLSINITEDIGYWGYNFQRLLSESKGFKGKKVRAIVNGYGGSVLDAVAIHNFLKGHPADVETHIPAFAISAHTLIAAAGDHVSMAENGFYMIHNPWSYAVGESAELQHEADILDKMKAEMVDIYYARTKRKMGKKEIARMMDDETWMTAQEALAMGFVDELTSGAQINAKLDPEKFKAFTRVPVEFKALIEKPKTDPQTTTVHMSILDKIKAWFGKATATDTELETILTQHRSLGEYRDSITAEARASLEALHAEALASLKTASDANAASLATAQATVTSQAATITDLQAKVTALETQVATLQAQPAAERGAGKREDEPTKEEKAKWGQGADYDKLRQSLRHDRKKLPFDED